MILKTKIDFKCEIKFASRWQKVTGNKWVTAIEQNHLNNELNLASESLRLNHLNDWIIQERITVMLLRDAKQRCGCL